MIARRGAASSLAIVLSLFVLPAANAAQAASCENGLYLTPTWLQATKSDAEVGALVKSVASLGMTQLFLPAKGFGLEQRAGLDRFRAIARGIDPRVRVLAMIGRRVCGQSKEACFDASDAEKQRRLEATATDLWSAGFDGVQIDFEPVPDGDDVFVVILGRLRAARPPGKTLSLAGYFVQPDDANRSRFHPRPQSNAPLLQWTPGYYRRLLALVDQVMVMVYDTALTHPDEYRAFVAWQVSTMLDLVRPNRVGIQIGLPSDVPGRTGLYDRAAENLRTGIDGVAEALHDGGGQCPSGFGITVFAEGGFSPALRQSFRDTWASRRATSAAPRPPATTAAP